MRLFWMLLKNNLRCELIEPVKFLSSVFFSLTLLFLFSISIGEVERLSKASLFSAQIFLGSFLILQIVHGRIFVHDEEDDAQLLILHKIGDSNAFYWAKLSFSFILCLAILTPYLFFLGLFNGFEFFSFFTLVLVVLMIFSLSALGILLCQLTKKASNKALIYPLLYFPLNIPVLLISIETHKSYLAEIDLSQTLNWTLLLVSFSVIYTTLGTMLFGEMQGLD